MNKTELGCLRQLSHLVRAFCCVTTVPALSHIPRQKKKNREKNLQKIRYLIV